MNEHKYRRFYVDWWNIRKSTIYGIIATVLILGALFGGGWWLWKNEFFLAKTTVEDIPKDAARIISFEGDVRVTRSSTRETILVTKTTYVSAGDTVQTQADGRAQIQMIDGSVLTIRPNSTVIIRDSSSMFGGKNVRVELGSGQLNVKTEDLPADTENIVEVEDSENKLLSQTDASFGTNPNGEGGEIRVSRGGVETNAGGEKTMIQNGEFAAVNNGRITSKEGLLNPPPIVSPNAQTSLQASAGGSATVTFSWERPAASIQSYHLQISKNPFFVPDAIVFERTALTSTSFSVSNLAPGTYHWQIRAIANSGQASEWSEKVRFTVVKGAASQSIGVSDWSVEKLGGKVYRIKGRTQAGAVVRAGDRETFSGADGSFTLQIASSTAEASVEVSDDRGNRSGFVISLSSGRVLRQY